VLPHLMEHTQQVTSALYATTSGLHVLPHIWWSTHNNNTHPSYALYAEEEPRLEEGRSLALESEPPSGPNIRGNNKYLILLYAFGTLFSQGRVVRFLSKGPSTPGRDTIRWCSIFPLRGRDWSHGRLLVQLLLHIFALYAFKSFPRLDYSCFVHYSGWSSHFGWISGSNSHPKLWNLRNTT
jgi:hypothetical protein